MSTVLSRRIVRVYNNGLTKTVFDPGTNQTVSSMSMTKDDDLEVQVALTDTNSINPLDANNFPKAGAEMDATGCTFKLGIKTKTQYEGEQGYSLITQVTNPSSPWQDLSKGRISMLLTPGLAAGDYIIEFTAVSAVGKKVTSFLLALTIVQDLNLGTEGPPTPSTPTYYTAAETDALLASVSAAAGVYAAQYPFPLQVLVIDDGLTMARAVTVTRLSGWLQVAAQGQNVQVQLTRNQIDVGDLLQIRPGENTGDVTLSTPIDFMTTDEIGLEIVQIGSNVDAPGQNLRARIHFERKT